MSVIIISAEPYCKGDRIAGLVAQQLNYKCMGPDAIIAEAAQRYGVSASKLAETMEEISTLLDKLSNTQTRFLAYLQAAFLGFLGQDQIVFYGQSEHLFVEGVSHVLKVRISADLEQRAQLKAQSEQISEKRAREGLLKASALREKWEKFFFDSDGTDPSLFDMTLDVSHMDEAEAAAKITEAAKDIKFQAITYSLKCMQDIELSSRVRAALIESYPDIQIQAKDGNVAIQSKTFKKKKRDKILALKKEVENIQGVAYMEVL